MTREETVTLTRYIKALCPQQQIDQFTPIAWHDVLGNLGFDDCHAAASALAARQPFIAPSEIIREIAAKRSVSQPHSNACRSGDCRDCHVSWCMCACHPSAVAALTKPPTPARGGEPRQLGGELREITGRRE